MSSIGKGGMALSVLGGIVSKSYGSRKPNQREDRYSSWAAPFNRPSEKKRS
jgi:hypothetical protein